MLVDEMPYAPRTSYSVSLDYNNNVFSGQELHGYISYSYKGESESGIVLGTSNLNDSYRVVDANLSLSGIPFLQGELKLTLWGQNLADEEYAVANIGPFAMFGASGISPYGDPRTYGLTINYSFN
jgi:iron complex outermembrane receptor protein